MNNKKHRTLSVSAKIFGVVAFCLISLIGISGFSIYQMQQIGTELEGITERDIPLTSILTKLTTHQLEQTISYERAAKYGEHYGDNNHATELYNKSKIHFQELTAIVDNEIIKGEKIAQDALSHAANEAEKKEFQHIFDVLKKVERDHHDYDKQAHIIFSLLEAGKQKEAIELEEKFESQTENLIHELEELLFEVEKFTADAALTAEQHEILALRLLIILSVIVLVFATITSFLIVKKSLTGPLQQLVISIDGLLAGDTATVIDVKNNDEIGKVAEALNIFRGKLNENNQLQAEAAEQKKTSRKSSKAGPIGYGERARNVCWKCYSFSFCCSNTNAIICRNHEHHSQRNRHPSPCGIFCVRSSIPQCTNCCLCHRRAFLFSSGNHTPSSRIINNNRTSRYRKSKRQHHRSEYGRNGG